MQDEIQALFEKYVNSDNKLEDTDELFQSLVAAADRSKNPAEFYNLSGVGFYEREHFEHSAVLFERSVGCNPKNRQYLEHLAISYYRLQLYAKAIDYFQRIYELDPKDFYTAKNIAMTYLEMGMYHNVAHYLEDYLLMHGADDTDVWKTYLFVLHALNLSQIIVDLNECFDLDKFKDSDIQLTLFYAYYNCGLQQRALYCGQKLIDQNINVDIYMEMNELEIQSNAQTV